LSRKDYRFLDCFHDTQPLRRWFDSDLPMSGGRLVRYDRQHPTSTATLDLEF